MIDKTPLEKLNNKIIETLQNGKIYYHIGKEKYSIILHSEVIKNISNILGILTL